MPSHYADEQLVVYLSFFAGTAILHAYDRIKLFELCLNILNSVRRSLRPPCRECPSQLPSSTIESWTHLHMGVRDLKPHFCTSYKGKIQRYKPMTMTQDKALLKVFSGVDIRLIFKTFVHWNHHMIHHIYPVLGKCYTVYDWKLMYIKYIIGGCKTRWTHRNWSEFWLK